MVNRAEEGACVFVAVARSDGRRRLSWPAKVIVANHQISLIDDSGNTVGTWTAYNNVDSHATLRHVNNGNYNIQDRAAPHQHPADANGPYGSHGIVRFNVPGHPGIGVHSGRANARHQPGPQHATMGCIRTTDEAMASIANQARTSPLTTIEVVHNSGVAARAASQHHRIRRIGAAHPARAQ